MSFEACVSEIERAAGRKFSDDELDDLLTELQRRQRRVRQLNSLGDAEAAVMKAADDYARDLATAAMVEKRNAALNLKRRLEALDFIKAHDMTALVLHETDLVHQVVYPRDYFDPYALWKDAPTRRGENAIFNNRVYFDHILQLARNAGVEVYVEVKEIGFSDEVLEYKPALIKNGVVCPTEPFWFDYIERKTDELLRDFPLLADWYRQGQLKLDELVTRTITLEETEEAFAAMERGETLRSVIVF